MGRDSRVAGVKLMPGGKRVGDTRIRECRLFPGAALLHHKGKFKWYRPLQLLWKIEVAPEDASVRRRTTVPWWLHL